MSEPNHPSPSAKHADAPVPPPGVIDLNWIETTAGLDSITEATVKFETPKAREARENFEARNQAHQHLISLIRVILASLLVLGFFALGVFLLAFKPNATEAERNLAVVILTAIVTGGVGYLFGKQEGANANKE